MSDNLIHATKSAYNYPLLIKNILKFPCADNPAREIVYRDLRRFTYAELRQRINRLASALTRMGVKAGDTVAVMDWDSHRYLECFFAVPMIGAVLHTINVRLSAEQVLYTIEHAEDDVILLNAEFIPIIEKIRGRITTVRDFVLLTDDATAPETAIKFTGEYEAMLEAASTTYDFPDFDENTRATTFYTTGTTGMPKGVYFSHRQLVMHTMVVMAAIGSPSVHGRFHRDDVYMPITPMFHVHAWGVPYVATSLGVKQVYPGKYSPEMLLGLLSKEKVTFSHCVPTILHMLLKSPEAAKVDFRGWKCLIGGSAMPKALCLEGLRRGMDLIAGYGMSETCPILSIAHMTEDMIVYDEADQAEVRCKTGRPLPLVDMRIVDSDMRDVPHDGKSTGEIVVRSPWLTQGYLKDAKSSERLWEGGYLHTADVANRDGRGYFKITDRLKDVIKVGGEWISSLELEDIIAQYPGVSEVAVIGQPDEKWGERPLALVVPKPDTQLTERELVHHIVAFADKGVVTKQVVLFKVRIVEAIDKTSVGKVNKVALRDKYLPRA